MRFLTTNYDQNVQTIGAISFVSLISLFSSFNDSVEFGQVKITGFLLVFKVRLNNVLATDRQLTFFPQMTQLSLMLNTGRWTLEMYVLYDKNGKSQNGGRHRKKTENFSYRSHLVSLWDIRGHIRFKLNWLNSSHYKKNEWKNRLRINFWTITCSYLFKVLFVVLSHMYAMLCN